MNELAMMDKNLSIDRTPELIAIEINSIKEQTRKMVLFNSIEIGRRLTEAKTMLGHGEWGEWLDKSVDYSQRTANNLMRIFDEYGSSQITFFCDNAKSQALANLSYTQAVALLGIPQEEREAFIQEHDIENLSTRELQQAIKERDQALKQLEDAQRVAAEKSEEASKLLTEKKVLEDGARISDQVIEKAQQDIKNLQESLRKEKESKKADIEKLQAALEEAKNSGNNEEVERLNGEIGRISESLVKTDEELDNAYKKIEELERQLKEKPIEVTATVEKIPDPDEVQQELDELRKKAGQQDNPASLKFKVYFDELVKGFQSLLGTLAEVPEDETERYKKAVLGLIGKMSERLT